MSNELTHPEAQLVDVHSSFPARHGESLRASCHSGSPVFYVYYTRIRVPAAVRNEPRSENDLLSDLTANNDIDTPLELERDESYSCDVCG